MGRVEPKYEQCMDTGQGISLEYRVWHGGVGFLALISRSQGEDRWIREEGKRKGGSFHGKTRSTKYDGSLTGVLTRERRLGSDKMRLNLLKDR